jgi:hypothetical protein
LVVAQEIQFGTSYPLEEIDENLLIAHKCSHHDLLQIEHLLNLRPQRARYGAQDWP